MSTTPNDTLAKASEKKLVAMAKQAAQKKGGWRAIAGKAADDHLLREAMELGREWREQSNKSGF